MLTLNTFACWKCWFYFSTNSYLFNSSRDKSPINFFTNFQRRCFLAHLTHITHYQNYIWIHKHFLSTNTRFTRPFCSAGYFELNLVENKIQLCALFLFFNTVATHLTTDLILWCMCVKRLIIINGNRFIMILLTESYLLLSILRII